MSSQTPLEAATDIVDAAAKRVAPADQAELFWSILVVAGAALVTVHGDDLAAEKVYRLADGIVGRKAEGVR